MNQIERRDKGLAYVCDDEAFAQQAECRKLLQQLNFMDRSDFDGIKEVVKKLFGKSDEPFVNPPFYCDYGFNIEVGKEFFANYNCTKSATIVCSRRMWRFIPQDIPYTPTHGVPIMNSENPSQSAITFGLAATP